MNSCFLERYNWESIINTFGWKRTCLMCFYFQRWYQLPYSQTSIENACNRRQEFQKKLKIKIQMGEVIMSIFFSLFIFTLLSAVHRCKCVNPSSLPTSKEQINSQACNIYFLLDSLIRNIVSPSWWDVQVINSFRKIELVSLIVNITKWRRHLKGQVLFSL